MARLIVLSGFSGAGKSTLARALNLSGRYALIASDDYHHCYNPETDVTGLLIALATAFCAVDISVIVDAVNKHPGDSARWHEAGRAFASFEWLDLDVPLQECIRRDSMRVRPVGEAAIRAQLAASL